jgi:hypothetical protein
MLKPSITTATASDKILDDVYLQFFSRLRRQPDAMRWSVGGGTLSLSASLIM